MNSQIKAVSGGIRLSNIEALRLLSMLMVLNLHSFKGYTHGEGVLNFLDFFRESTSICAVDVFILISGYFGIKWKKQSFFNLIFQIVFYSIGVYSIAVLLGIIPFEMGTFLKCFSSYFFAWGVVTSYLVLYVISPILNKYSEGASKKELFVFIFLLFIAANTICFTTGILTFLLLYLIGRFIKKIDLVSFDSRKPWIEYLVCTIIITIITFLLFRLPPIKTAGQMTSIPIGYSYNSPFVIFQSVFLFLCFARMSFTNRFVNWCANSCLAIFLIHMHPSVKQIYYSYTESLYGKSLTEHIGLLCITFFAVFWGAIFIDKVRILLSVLLYRLLSIIKNMLPSNLFVMENYLTTSMKQMFK